MFYAEWRHFLDVLSFTAYAVERVDCIAFAKTLAKMCAEVAAGEYIVARLLKAAVTAVL